jgi:opacity protein-like surface antigen
MTGLKLTTVLCIAIVLTGMSAAAVDARTSADNFPFSKPENVVTPSVSSKDDAGNKLESTLAQPGSKEKTAISRDASDPEPRVEEEKAPKETASSTTVSTNPQPRPGDEWHFQFTPYLWIPSISGRAGIGNLETDLSTGESSTGVEINFGFMGTFEARKNKFIILTDLLYSDLATERGNPGPLFSSSRASFKTFIFHPEVGYRVVDNGKGAFVDVLAGVKYWHLNANLAFGAGVLPATEVERSRSWVDVFGGLRARAPLGKRFFAVGKAGLGGGGSEFTYGLFGGLGLTVTDRVALIGGYRVLSVDYDKDGFLFDVSLHGPIMGVGFKF